MNRRGLNQKTVLIFLLSMVVLSVASPQKPNLFGIPITPELLDEAGKLNVSDPDEAFNPHGEWEQTWRMWLPGRGKPIQNSGFLKLHRLPDANGTGLSYKAFQVVSEDNSWIHSTRVEITAQNDALGTPLKWKKSTRFHTSPASGSKHLEDIDAYNEESLQNVPNSSSNHFVSSYNLFDVIQRMDFENVTSIDFTLLDELDKVKENHSIRFMEETSINFAGKDRAVKVYAETGEGMLPWIYYVDGQSRLLLAISGMRTFILDNGFESAPGEKFNHPELGVEKLAMKSDMLQKTDIGNPPNILFVTSDQQAWNTLSYYGNRDLSTPSLDRLAREGVSFRKSYTANPVCSPARATWLTGLTTSENGVISNGLDIVENIETVADVLKEKGYETVFAGKLHVGIPKSYGETIPGFSKVLCQGIGGKGTLGDQVVSSVCEGYLQNRDKSKPFFLSVNFLQPHDICNWISRHTKSSENPFYELIADELPQLPENFGALLTEPGNMKITRRDAWDEKTWKYYLWSYSRMMEEVDAEIGRVMRAIEESGELDNTVIIFNSDHGEGGGHHQSVLKDQPYDEASRVPFIIRYPRELKQGVIDEDHLVSGLDVVPTICDFAGTKLPANAKGLSVRNISAGSKSEWRNFVVVELNKDKGRVVRSDRYKLIAFRDDPEILFFDMKNDPGETRNLAVNKKYEKLLDEHIRMLEEWESKLILAPNALGAFEVKR